MKNEVTIEEIATLARRAAAADQTGLGSILLSIAGAMAVPPAYERLVVLMRNFVDREFKILNAQQKTNWSDD